MILLFVLLWLNYYATTQAAIRNWQCNLCKTSIDKIPWSKFIDYRCTFPGQPKVMAGRAWASYQQGSNSLIFGVLRHCIAKRQISSSQHTENMTFQFLAKDLCKSNAWAVFPALHLFFSLIHSLSKNCIEQWASRDYGESSEGYDVTENSLCSTALPNEYC